MVPFKTEPERLEFLFITIKPHLERAYGISLSTNDYSIQELIGSNGAYSLSVCLPRSFIKTSEILAYKDFIGGLSNIPAEFHEPYFHVNQSGKIYIKFQINEQGNSLND